MFGTLKVCVCYFLTLDPSFLFQYLSSGEVIGKLTIATDVASRKVMGMTLLDHHLFVVYHKTSAVHAYDVTDLTGVPARDVSGGASAAWVIDTELKWPRGIAANGQTKALYAIDWTNLFSGELVKMSTTAVLKARVGLREKLHVDNTGYRMRSLIGGFWRDSSLFLVSGVSMESGDL